MKIDYPVCVCICVFCWTTWFQHLKPRSLQATCGGPRCLYPRRRPKNRFGKRGREGGWVRELVSESQLLPSINGLDLCVAELVAKVHRGSCVNHHVCPYHVCLDAEGGTLRPDSLWSDSWLPFHMVQASDVKPQQKTHPPNRMRCPLWGLEKRGSWETW